MEQQTQSDTLVSFRGVQKSYDGDSLVVKRLDLDIRRGEFLTLLGPSGSGKTTVLMMLAGFESPTAGEIRLDGQLLNRMPPHKRGIGMVFQNYALFPHMTVGDNVAYPLTVRSVAKAQIAERVQKALGMVELGKLAHRYPSQLSGGQQQRVALARALVFEPKLVLMDEPLGALDKQLREHMQLEIKHIHQTLGVTVVFVTHDQSEALTMSDRVAVFKDGIIQQIDSPAALYETPANSFVAQFIGENNVLAGQVVSLDNGYWVARGEGQDLSARAICVNAPGDATTLSIRPERVRLDQAAAACDNRIEGTLTETIYLGDHVRLRVNVPGQPNFFIKVPIADLTDSMQRHGARLTLGWRREDLRALDAA